LGVIVGEWLFPDGTAPSPDAVVEKLRERTGLAIRCGHAADGRLDYAEFALINESLFDWSSEDNRVAVRSFVPAHPYLWMHLNAAMIELGGRLSENPIVWRPESRYDGLNRRWSELSKRQRFFLSLPTLGTWRPLDFLAAQRNADQPQ
jgi:hypothetical protein